MNRCRNCLLYDSKEAEKMCSLVEEYAREKFGLVYKDEIVFVPEEK